MSADCLNQRITSSKAREDAKRSVLRTKFPGMHGSVMYLIVEVVKEAQHAMLIMRVCFIDVLQQLDLIQTLVKVVFVVLQSPSLVKCTW